MKAVIIGGGITGLTAAYRLLSDATRAGVPLDVVLLEGSDRLGGVISTEEYQGAFIENGPDSFITTKPAALLLCGELGLVRNLVETNNQFRRAFVAFRNKLHPLPEGFFMLAPSQMMPVMQSSLFSPGGKLRMLMDVVLPAKPDVVDESLASFVKRRLGQEVLDRVAQPMMAGIYTADPEQLSLRSTMPQFLQYEADYGSVIVGLQEQRKKAEGSSIGTNDTTARDAGVRYSMFVTLDRGMQLLVSALTERIGNERIRLNTSVSAIGRETDRWRVHLEHGETVDADALILAVSANKCAKLLQAVAPPLAESLGAIEYASSIVLNLVYNRSDVPNPLDGFGFVVPTVEHKNIIACSYSSIKFPNRAPDGMVTLRVFLGGALRPEVTTLSEQQVLSLARRDLHHYLGIKAEPIWYKLARWAESMPQYAVGHAGRVDEIMHAAHDLPGLFLAGNAYGGVGIPDCVRSGESAARLAIERLQSCVLS
jgi:oxygen-dependent protoporphyrinogen oxidase